MIVENKQHIRRYARCSNKQKLFLSKRRCCINVDTVAISQFATQPMVPHYPALTIALDILVVPIKALTVG